MIRYRLNTEHTVERVDERKINTEHGEFTLVTYRDKISRDIHFALVRGEVNAHSPTLVRVHVKNPLTDVLHWQRDSLSISAHQAMATIAKENAGVLVVLSEPISSEQLLAQITEQDGIAATKIKQWRQNGAGAQILADLGLSKLRVLGTPRRQVALAGFGLEVIEYVGPHG